MKRNEEPIINKRVVITNGTGGCGKDTFAEMADRYCFSNKISSIDPIKDIAKYVGWDGSKTEKDRKLLSDLKLLLTEYNDLPFEYMTQIVNEFNDFAMPGSILFVDIREPDEVERAKNQFNAITVLIKNDRIKPIESNMADAHVFDYAYDYIIDNSGSLDDLDAAAKLFVEEVLGE